MKKNIIYSILAIVISVVMLLVLMNSEKARDAVIKMNGTREGTIRESKESFEGGKNVGEENVGEENIGEEIGMEYHVGESLSYEDFQMTYLSSGFLSAEELAEKGYKGEEGLEGVKIAKATFCLKNDAAISELMTGDRFIAQVNGERIIGKDLFEEEGVSVNYQCWLTYDVFFFVPEDVSEFSIQFLTNYPPTPLVTFFFEGEQDSEIYPEKLYVKNTYSLGDKNIFLDDIKITYKNAFEFLMDEEACNNREIDPQYAGKYVIFNVDTKNTGKQKQSYKYSVFADGKPLEVVTHNALGTNRLHTTLDVGESTGGSAIRAFVPDGLEVSTYEVYFYNRKGSICLVYTVE